MEQIKYKGVSDLSKEEQATVNKLCSEYYEKIKRDIKNITSIEVNVKTHDAEGKRKRYEIQARVIAPTKVFEASYDEWELPLTLHRVFKKIEVQLEKAFQ